MGRHPSQFPPLHVLPCAADGPVDLGAERQRRRPVLTLPMAFAIVAGHLSGLDQATAHRVLALVAAHRGIALVKPSAEDVREARLLSEFGERP